jgi:pyridoxamine 5'-phosphate oxidase
MNDLSNYRKSYEKNELIETQVSTNPFELFENWFQEVETKGGVDEVNAMTVATIGLDGYPKSRVVLLKQFSTEGLVFYTNYDSEKGRAIAKNPKLCISFFWHNLERQVIIKGTAQKVPTATSDQYFYSRPIGSQLGAIASNQSEVIPSRNYLENRLKDLEIEFKAKTINRPQNWGGYIVKPVQFEFWQGRPNRLHDRIRFSQMPDGSWKLERLSS